MLNPLTVRTLTPATGGFATSVWRVETAQHHYALRAFDARGVPTLGREWLAMRAAHSAGVPVPRVHAVGTWDERPAMLLDWAVGQPLLDALRTSPREVVGLGIAFGRTQAAMHRIQAPPSLRGTWLDWPNPTEPELARRLHAIAPRADRLLHLDYHPLNVIVDAGRVTAIIDWTNAHRGDPRADVARTLSILRLLPLDAPPRQRLAQRVFEAAWRLGYGRFGRDMRLFCAWAGGAMLHDLEHRYSEAELEPISRWTLAQLR
jgi:aminoglycoside phosphotransferase (APT) family kinase protein